MHTAKGDFSVMLRSNVCSRQVLVGIPHEKENKEWEGGREGEDRTLKTESKQVPRRRSLHDYYTEIVYMSDT